MPQSIPHRLGQILLKQNKVSQAQLNDALELQAKSHQPLGEALISLGYLTQIELARALKKQNKLRTPAVCLAAMLAPLSLQATADDLVQDNFYNTTDATQNYQHLNQEATAQDWLKTAAKAVWSMYQQDLGLQKDSTLSYSISHNEQVDSYNIELSFRY